VKTNVQRKMSVSLIALSFFQESILSLHSHTNVQWTADITREIILQHKRYAPLKCDTYQNVVKFSYIIAGYTNRWLALVKKTTLYSFSFIPEAINKTIKQLIETDLFRWTLVFTLANVYNRVNDKYRLHDNALTRVPLVSSNYSYIACSFIAKTPKYKYKKCTK
jgi:hypothetical protein